MSDSFNPVRRAAVAFLFAATVAIAAIPAGAQQTEETKPENVPNPEPAFFVHADVDRIDRAYREGDPLFITAICEQDAYLYVFYEQADGKSMLVYPNSRQKNNFVKAKQKVQVPAGDDLFRWRVGAPFGKETIFVIASKEPIENLEDPKFREKRFNDVSVQEAAKTAKAMKAAEPAKWARDLVEITTKAKTEPVVASQARRFGVFFGVKHYKFQEEVLAAGKEHVEAGRAESAWDPDMPWAENNVQVISQMFKSMGKLDDLKTYDSAGSTKANLKYAITQWLPSVSKPGDTVFIYWSSHGSKMPDDDGDEADQQDEWLVVGDYIDLGILKQLQKKQAAGKLDADLSRHVDELTKIAQQAGDKADEALSRHTGVTDDLFAHWLQSLAGRQVVVMLDTCHSGGFFVNEKSLTKDKQNANFDFLNGETSRLKDLGQQECAMMSACTTQQSCYIHHLDDEMMAFQKLQQKLKGEVNFNQQTLPMFVFTYYLAKALAFTEGPADITKIHANCVEGMRSYFPKINAHQREFNWEELIPHEAILYNSCTKPVIMKP